MKWFKHYSNASLSNKLTKVRALHGIEGYGRYWLLLELCCEKFDGENDDMFVFSTRTLREDLGFHHTKGLLKYLQCLSNVGVISCVTDKNVIEIKTDILLRLQGRDYKKTRSKRAKTAPKKETKNKSKDIEEDKECARISEYNLIEIWNKKFPEKRFKAFSFGGGVHYENFKISTGYLTGIENWSELFETAKASQWLSVQPFFGLLWCLSYDNILKIQSDVYKNNSESLDGYVDLSKIKMEERAL